jgi:hypothetical protein
MRGDVKGADDTVTMVIDDDESTTCKPRTPATCHREPEAILKYRKVLQHDGDGLFCTPKKKLKLEKEEVSNSRPRLYLIVIIVDICSRVVRTFGPGSKDPGFDCFYLHMCSPEQLIKGRVVCGLSVVHAPKRPLDHLKMSV